MSCFDSVISWIICLLKNINFWIMGATIVIAIATCIYVHYAKQQWITMSGQLEQMQGASNQTQDLIAETRNLANNAEKQANNTETLANSTKSEVIKLQSLVEVTRTSADAAKKSADIAEKAMIAAHRPWVFADVKIDGDITVRADRVTVPITFTIKNVGTAPAIGVEIEPSVHFTDGGFGGDNDILEIQQNQLTRASNRTKQTDSGFNPPSKGRVLIPGQEITTERMYFMIDQSVINETAAKYAARFNMPPETIMIAAPFVIGCVSYWSTLEKSIHKTGLIWKIFRFDPSNVAASGAIDVKGGDVPAALLKVLPYEIGNYAD